MTEGPAMSDPVESLPHRAPSDPRELRRALGRFATGVTVVTTVGADRAPVGLTANSFSSVSLDPPLILWSLANDATSLDAFKQAEWFAVNVLGSHQQNLSNQFASKGIEKFGGVDYEEGLGGCPVLIDSLACFECTVYDRVLAGDHTIFLGKVERLTHREGVPLLYSSGRYCIPSQLLA